ncbi:response regulator [Oscillatoriales cyanobacterium LEGE 11467]|uniref:Response regulator n=1 Tax=Zarconia navalis LEGE 11467 TaxID=1828826 RepID=A0A928Z8L6_9CYAN|nr:response regulator [Zarconia navalis]MBE9039971.1 response regulator [Zarconia navalis LEGE 11467]
MTTVMVIEDSLAQRELISHIINRGGWKVTKFSDGIEALRSLNSQLPDLILLDVVMPRMNGYEVCRRLKKNQTTKNIPIILCSSKGHQSDRYWAMKQGADAYLVKPFHPIELLKTVKINLERASNPKLASVMNGLSYCQTA